MEKVELLCRQLGEAGRRLRARLAGLTDEEFLWEPVPGCWTVRRRATASTRLANGCGEWVVDYDLPEPDPPPFTTIAWRLLHVTLVNLMYDDHALGPGTMGFDDHEIPYSADGSIRWWEESWRRLHSHMARLEDADLPRVVRPPWMGSASVEEMLGIAITESFHHGAEVGCLRDLYRQRGQLRA